MKSLFHLVLATIASIAFSSAAAAPSKVLTEAEMHALAIAGVKATVPRALQHQIDFERSTERGYALFEGLINVGEGHVGVYAIDPRTGDMWDAVLECGEITSPEIWRLQRKFHRRLGLSRAQYVKIRRRGPMCDQLPK